MQIAVAKGESGEELEWERLIIYMRQRYGDDGVWETFLEIRKKGFGCLLSEPHNSLIRDHILSVALKDSSRIATLFECAEQLRRDYHFEWPNLYTKIVNFYLVEADYDAAFLWHMRLVPHFPPSIEKFGALLSSFAVDPTPKMQSTLTTMYVFSSHRKLYDYVIPALFHSGQSNLARAWRKRLVVYQDFPETSVSQPFLRFVTRYYPMIPLASEELTIIDLKGPTALQRKKETSRLFQQRGNSRGYFDHFTAQWFATSWTSAEFVINLLHRLGLRVISPEALRSLALREDTAKGVADRITQLEQLGISTKPRRYNKALVYFAKQGDTKLLWDLLHSDIPFDMFENANSRNVLLADAVRQQDWKQERLLQAFEWAIEKKSMPRQLNSLLKNILSREGGIGKARIILDRMSSLNVPVSQANASALLNHVFQSLRYYPLKQNQSSSGHLEARLVDRAIHVVRKLASQDVAICTSYWRILLYNLGRVGRFDEFEQLGLEIVRLYGSRHRGLMPVHRLDVPKEIEVELGGVIQSRASLTDSQKKQSINITGISTVPATQTSKHSPYSEDFWKAEMGVKYKSPEELEATARMKDNSDKADPSTFFTPSSGKKNVTHSSYSEDFWRAEMGEKYKPPVEVPAVELLAERKTAPKTQKSKTQFKQYVPADLPFTHREHPVQKIFDPRLQRAIIRWGFDQTLKSPPTPDSLLGVANPRPEAFDVALGVRLLANLRDKGVLIDKQVIRSTVHRRMGLAGVPLRPRARARDAQELSVHNIKALVDRAWGSEILSEASYLMKELEDQKPKLWSRYRRLFRKSYDRQWTSGEAQEELDQKRIDQELQEEFDKLENDGAGLLEDELFEEEENEEDSFDDDDGMSASKESRYQKGKPKGRL